MRSRTAIDRLISRRDIRLGEKTLWRMLYETCARTEELLQLNIQDLDLAGRCARMKSKGAEPRTRRRTSRSMTGSLTRISLRLKGSECQASPSILY